MPLQLSRQNNCQIEFLLILLLLGQELWYLTEPWNSSFTTLGSVPGKWVTVHGWAQVQPAAVPTGPCPLVSVPPPACRPRPTSLFSLQQAEGKLRRNCHLQPTSPQTQETEMMQLSREQVKQQLHKHGIVQARLCSCPLTWHLHDDSTGSTGHFISTGSVSQYSQSSAQAISKQFDEVKNNSYWGAAILNCVRILVSLIYLFPLKHPLMYFPLNI